MSKLTKAQAKAHQQAQALIDNGRALTDDEKEFIARNWNEAATEINTILGAHFTPFDLALDFAWDCHGPKLLDLCAGIGVLGLAAVFRQRVLEENLVCIEINPRYIEIGKRLLPKARWIQADAFQFPGLGLGCFDCIMSNPPFGKSAKKTGQGRFYNGPDFDLALLDLASDHASIAVFILPQNNAAFRLSGQRCFERRKEGKGYEWQKITGLNMEPGIGIDASCYCDDWKTTSVNVEIVSIYADEFQDFRKQVEKPINKSQDLEIEITSPCHIFQNADPAGNQLRLF